MRIWTYVIGAIAGSVITLAAMHIPQATAQQAGQGPRNAQQAFGPMIEAIRATPGCLGVEAARLQSGKLAIFAFFKDREAAKAWYYHPVHKKVMRDMMPDAVPPEGHEPMSDVPPNTPVLACATITPPAAGEGLSQIAIELYTPLTGGLVIGEGFAPKGFAAPSTQPAAR